MFSILNKPGYKDRAYHLFDRLRDELDGITVMMCLTKDDPKWKDYRVNWVAALKLMVDVTDSGNRKWTYCVVTMEESLDGNPVIVVDTRGRKTFDIFKFTNYKDALDFIKVEIGAV